MSGGVAQVGLVLQAHQTIAAQLVQQILMGLAAVNPLVQEILEGLGDDSAGGGILRGLLGLGSGGSQLLVLFTGEESTLFSSALEEIVSYQPPEDVRQVFLCSDSRALFAGASGVVQIDFNR